MDNIKEIYTCVHVCVLLKYLRLNRFYYTLLTLDIKTDVIAGFVVPTGEQKVVSGENNTVFLCMYIVHLYIILLIIYFTSFNGMNKFQDV